MLAGNSPFYDQTQFATNEKTLHMSIIKCILKFTTIWKKKDLKIKDSFDTPGMLLF
jgi:hypothetical protein